MKLFPLETAEQRLDRLEARVAELAAAVERLNAPARRAAPPVPQLPQAPPAGETESDEDAETFPKLVPNAGTVLAVLSALGTSFLVLGGALLIRTITDAGAVHRTAGIAAGFGYALACILAAVRLAGKGRRINASFLGVTAVVIGDPLLFEAVTRFHAVGPWTASAALVLLTVACLAAGRRRDLGSVAWIASLAAAGTAAVLSIVAGAVAPFAAALLAIGIAALWLEDGSLGWSLLRWPTAAAADTMVLWMAAALLTAEASPTANREAGLLFVPLALALPILYVGTFLVQTLLRRREVGVFEALQTFGSLVIGLGGAVVGLRAAGEGTGALGAAALLGGAGLYAAALGLLERRESRRNVSWCATLALVLMLFGSGALLGAPALAWFSLLLALGSALASSKRRVLGLHAAVFAAAAAWQSGLAAAAVGSLILSAERSQATFSAAALATLAVAAGCLPLLERPAALRGNFSGRIACIAVSVIACFGAAGLVVALLRPFTEKAPGAADPAALALVRSAVLAGAAVVLALLRRRTSLPELGWLAYALVVLGGLKLVFEDLPAGRALTLFLAFGLYGAALLWIPKLLRRRDAADGEAGGSAKA